MRRALKAIRILFFLGFLTACAVFAWAHLWPDRSLETFKPASSIVCLAAGLKPDGTMGQFTRSRAQRCVDAYHAGLAPVVVVTGGNTTHAAPPTGEQMARFARNHGVPEQAIVVEKLSESTLQNALFTLPMLVHPRDIILVTDSFHLPRAAMSFYWAGARDMQLLAANPDLEWGDIPPRLLLAEVVKIWANGLRAPLYSLARAAGLPPGVQNWIVE